MNTLLPFIIAGIVTGAVYGLAATGLVLTYKTSGIFNFAQGAVAAAAGYVFYWIFQSNGLPWYFAGLISVFVLGPVMGLLLEVISRQLARQRVAMRIVGTIGIILIVDGLATVKYGSQSLQVPQYLPYGNDLFRVAGVNISYAQVTITGISLLAVVILWLFFRFSRTGVAMRAVVDDPELVGLHGMSPNHLRRLAWVIGATFAALSGVLIIPLVGLQAVTLTYLVVQAFGAAAVGGFSNIPLTYVGGILIGIASSVCTKYVLDVTWLSGLPASLPFIILIVVLLVLPKRRLIGPEAPERRTALPWHAPPRARIAAGILVLAFLATIPAFAGNDLPFYMTGLTQAILILSLGLLVRTAGLVSLCQAAFAAIGAVAFGQFAVELHLPWLLAVLLGAAVVIPVAALLAIPALRLSGLFLALATLGFGLMMEQLFYPTSFMFTSLGSGRPMPRPSIAPSDNEYYYIILAFLVGASLVMVALHRSRLGRLLRGMGESSTSVMTLGLNVTMTRAIVFCIAGYLAAIAGILYGGVVHFAVLGDPTYSSFNSLVLIAILAVMPFREPWYAVLAGITSVIPAYWHNVNATYWLDVLFGLSAVVVAMQGQTQPMPERLRSLIERLAAGKRPSPVKPGAPALGERPPAARTDPHTHRPPASLEVTDLLVRYGGQIAVDRLTLSAPLGTITGLIGPNGAGKTTTFNACSGLVQSSGGTIHYGTENITRFGVSRRGRLGIGRTFQTMQLGDSLTVLDNVLLGVEAAAGGSRIWSQLVARPSEVHAARQRAVEAIELCGLQRLMDRQAGALSTGQRRLVELARCLAGDFDMLLLDEPSSGLNTAETVSFGTTLLSVAEQRGCGILLVEHDMSMTLRVCSTIYVLDAGKLLFTGGPKELRESAVVRTAYLGVDGFDLAEGAEA